MAFLNRPLSPRVESSLNRLGGMKASAAAIKRTGKLLGAAPVVIVTGQDKPKG